MKVTFRLIISLVLIDTAIAFGFANPQARQERIRLEEELSHRAGILAESLQESFTDDRISNGYVRATGVPRREYKTEAALGRCGFSGSLGARFP